MLPSTGAERREVTPSKKHSTFRALMRNLTLLLMLSRHFKKHDSTWRVPTNFFRCLTLMSIMNRALDWQESCNQRTRFRANSVLSHGNRVPTHTISLLCVTQKPTGLLTLRMAAYSRDFARDSKVNQQTFHRLPLHWKIPRNSDFPMFH